MAVSKKDKRYIVRNYPGMSVDEISRKLGLSAGEVKQVLAGAGKEVDTPPALPGNLLGSSPIHPFAILLLIAAISVIYLNSSRNGFHYDDIHSLIQNLGVRVHWQQDPESRWLFLRYFVEPELFSSRPQVAMPRPLLMVTFALNYMWTRYDAWSWILVNVIIHMLNSIIVYVGLCHLSGRPRLALFTALIFAIHPINTETVNYINCRSESLTAFFMLLTMYFFTRSMRDDSFGHRIACFVSFALGLLTKELAFVVPATLVAIDYLFIWPDNKDKIPIQDRVLKWYLPIVGIMIVYLIYRKIVLDYAVIDREVRPFHYNLLTQARVLVLYIRLLFWPVHQNISYENLAYPEALSGGPVFLSVMALSGLLGIMVWLRRQVPVVSFAIANFFITLSITTLVPLNAIMNEHRLYLPSLGAALLIGALFAKGADFARRKWNIKEPGWPPQVQFFALAILVFFGALTVNRNYSWHTDLSVWRDSIVNSPTKAQVVSDLGNAYYRGGRDLTERGDVTDDESVDMKEAAEIYKMFRVEVPVGKITPKVQKEYLDELYVQGLRRAEQLYIWGIKVEPVYYKAWHNLGTINYTYSRLPENRADDKKAWFFLDRAVKFFKQAAAISPSGESYNDGASAMLQMVDLEKDEAKKEKMLQEVIAMYREAIRLNPELYKSLLNIFMIQDKRGKGDENLHLLDQAAQINRVDPLPHFVKGRYLMKTQKLDQAMEEFQICLELAPNMDECRQGIQSVRKYKELENRGNVFHPPGNPRP